METVKSGSEPRTSGKPAPRCVCVCVCAIDVPCRSQNEWPLNIPECNWMREKLLIFTALQRNRGHPSEFLTRRYVGFCAQSVGYERRRYTKWPVFVKPVLKIGPLEVVTPSLSSASTDGAILQGWKKTAINLFCKAEDMWQIWKLGPIKRELGKKPENSKSYLDSIINCSRTCGINLPNSGIWADITWSV
jgi:hypothetical protein